MLVMSTNFHVGDGVGPEWFAQVHELQPAIILGQECNGGAFARLSAQLGRDYHIAPGMAFRIGGREPEATPVLMRRDVFGFVAQGNPLVSAWRGGGEHGRLWPTRWGTFMVGRHKRTGHMVRARSLHTWALGHNPPAAVVAEHEKQIAHARAWAARGGYVVLGGDTNDNPARLNLGLGLVASHDVDGIYARGFTASQPSVVSNASGSDHEMVLVRLRFNR